MGQFGAGTQLLYGVDDARVPAEDVVCSGDIEAEGVDHHARCERAGQLGAQLDVAGEGVDQAVDLERGLVGEALADCVEAKGAGEGRAVPGVLGDRPSKACSVPVIWPVVKRGSSTVRPTSSRIAARLSSRVVIIHPPSAGTQTTGPTVRSRASVGWGSRSRSSTVTQSADGTRVFMRAA